MKVSAPKRELENLIGGRRCRAVIGLLTVSLQVIRPAHGEVTILAVGADGSVIGAFGPWSSPTQLVSMLLLDGTMRTPRPDETLLP